MGFCLRVKEDRNKPQEALQSLNVGNPIKTLYSSGEGSRSPTTREKIPESDISIEKKWLLIKIKSVEKKNVRVSFRVLLSGRGTESIEDESKIDPEVRDCCLDPVTDF
ncbi:hypothetical protein KQX54_019828 [Cotesia glomerata]|uniref:Uncharacterized protein n=1 Tax=Cotesia glomerata TaxID=32391 RepID=A0AAV7J7I4_COTGL|nr:hypothetical protein KQX54_019828 [Cotesia glomerata]